MSGDIMEFPETVEEFMEEYKMVDKHEIYSNGTEYVPIFRMEQWFEHCKIRSANAKRYIDADALIAKWEEDIKHIPNASFRAMMQGAINEVTNAPTADVVEVVRCKDCSNWDRHWISSLFSENVHYCAFMYRPCSGDFYCAAAVKRQVLGGDQHEV